MEKLYKNKYLIAKYDTEDHLIAVGTSPIEVGMEKYEIQRAADNGKGKKYKIYLIDCTEKHDDIFAEEDEIFLQMFTRRSRTQAYEEYAKNHQMSVRSVQRRIKDNKLTYEGGEVYER